MMQFLSEWYLVLIGVGGLLLVWGVFRAFRTPPEDYIIGPDETLADVVERGRILQGLPSSPNQPTAFSPGRSLEENLALNRQSPVAASWSEEDEAEYREVMESGGSPIDKDLFLRRTTVQVNYTNGVHLGEPGYVWFDWQFGSLWVSRVNDRGSGSNSKRFDGRGDALAYIRSLSGTPAPPSLSEELGPLLDTMFPTKIDPV